MKKQTNLFITLLLCSLASLNGQITPSHETKPNTAYAPSVRDDIGLFRSNTRHWYFDHNMDGSPYTTLSKWGEIGDIPLAGDFDNDGFNDDLVVFRSSTKEWYFDFNNDMSTDKRMAPWGDVGDQPLVGDFDRDGFIDDLGVLRPTDREWYFDYDGDGITDKRVKPWGDVGDLESLNRKSFCF